MVAVQNEAQVLTLRPGGWDRPLVDSPSEDDPERRYRLTSHQVEVDGTGTIPVSGELHYSRIPRDRWLQRLRQLQAGGVTVVATYVFWNHHAETGPTPSFAGRLDLAAFVGLCEQVGLDVVVRLGPWCHGETRNGGLPDWVIESCPATRTNDPVYLGLVETWFGQLSEQLRDHLGPRSRVIGIQLENELYDNPDHIVTLKRLAQRCGLRASLWTATAWGSADLPAGEVLPLYGGYGDGFWVDADAPWDATFRSHYFFSHTWDDPGIGADVRARYGPAAQPPRPHPLDYPVATCELAGGMATAYHRRPWPEHLDVAAIAHTKLGSGSAWQGYYMYAGGINPAGGHGLQESHATGYPNDLERIGYDFHAVIGQAGTLRPSHAELRLQHAFIAAFGELLSAAPSTLPADLPTGVHDTTTLRWSWRGTDEGGFVFVNWHQPHEPLSTYRGARFALDLADRRMEFPSDSVDIPPGTLARWPVNLSEGGVVLCWATASVITRLAPGADHPATLVLLAEQGIPVQLAVDPDTTVDDLVPADRRNEVQPYELDAAQLGVPVRLRTGQQSLDLLVLPAAWRQEIWVLETGRGRELVRSNAELVVDDHGQIHARDSERPDIRRYDPTSAAWIHPVLRHVDGEPSVQELATRRTRRPEERPPPSYGEHQGRASAPSQADIARLGYRFEVTAPQLGGEQEATVEIDWAGDVAVVVVDGRIVTDRFWDGSVWELDLRDLDLAGGFEIWIVPLRQNAPVWVPEAAQRQREETAGDLVRLEWVRLRRYGNWTAP